MKMYFILFQLLVLIFFCTGCSNNSKNIINKTNPDDINKNAAVLENKYISFNSDNEEKTEFELDEDWNTAWVEGVTGDGIGEYIEFTPTETLPISGIKLINGYAKSQEIYNANNRIKRIRIEFADGEFVEYDLVDDRLYFQTIEFDKTKEVLVKRMRTIFQKNKLLLMRQLMKKLKINHS